LIFSSFKSGPIITKYQVRNTTHCTVNQSNQRGTEGHTVNEFTGDVGPLSGGLGFRLVAAVCGLRRRKLGEEESSVAADCLLLNLAAVTVLMVLLLSMILLGVDCEYWRAVRIITVLILCVNNCGDLPEKTNNERNAARRRQISRGR
jgi:hypothetical protein